MRAGICIVMVFALAFAGCAPGPKQGARVPEFGPVEASSGVISSQSLAGATVVYYFWATWCAPCVVASPEIQALQERYADNDAVRVVGVHYDNRGTPREYMAQHGYTWELIPDGRDIVGAFGIRKIPQVVVAGPNGRVLHAQVGFAEGDGAAIAAVVERALQSDR